MKIFIFTTGLNYWNTLIINSLLKQNSITIKGIYISKPQAGDYGLFKKVKRLLSYGFYNLLRIAFQKYFNSDNCIVKNSLKEYNKLINKTPVFTGDSFNHCLSIANNSNYFSILIYFNRIIPKKYVVNSDIINIHPSYLPYYKGVQPVFWALLNNEKEIGVSIHKVDVGIDTGPIYEQYMLPVLTNSINELMIMISKKIAINLPLLLNKINKNEAIPKKQKMVKGNYYSRPISGDIKQFFRLGKRYY